MQIYDVPYLDNTIKDVSGRLIGESILQDSLNILFDNKKIRNRYGIQELSESLPSGVVKISFYKQLYSSNIYIVAFTSTDIYYLNNLAKWTCITRNFTHGTCNCSGTAVTLVPPTAVSSNINTANSEAVEWTISVVSVTGVSIGMHVTGTNIPSKTYVAAVDTINNIVTLSKQTTAIPSGSMTFTWHFLDTIWVDTNCYIAFGYTDINVVPPASWIQITSFDSDTGITLSSTGGTLSGSSYVIIRKYNGDFDNVWQTCFPYDDSMEGGGDKSLIAVNGVDNMQRWKGEQSGDLTYCEDVLTYLNLCKHVGFWGTVGAEHIICSNVYDSLSSAWNATVIEVSDAGEISWQDGATYPLYDSTSEILGVVSLQTRFVIYKRQSLSLAEASYSSDVTNPFTIQQDLKRSIGTCSIDTVVDTGQFHLFFTGSRIAKFDGYNHAYIDEGNYLSYNKLINQEYVDRSFAFHLEDRNLYCLAVPTGESEYCNFVIVYNYDQQNFTFWDFTGHGGTELLMTTKGLFSSSSAITWDSRIIDGITGSASSSSTVTITGGVTGLLAGMRIYVGTYSATHLYIKSVGVSSVVVGNTSDETSVNPALITPLAITASGAVRAGYTAAQSSKRWSDLVSTSSSVKIILGDSTGYLYELNSFYDSDSMVASEYDIGSFFITRDAELNKGLTFLITAITLRLARLTDADGTYFTGSVFISASVNYGLNWSEEIELALDGTEEFMEKKVGLHMRGKAIRFKVRSESAFVFENYFLEYNVEGRSFKYDR